MFRNLRQTIVLLSLTAALASAASVTIPANLYGHLDQNTTNFCLNNAGASFGCGPVATVNSFLMLDNKYGTSLIPDSDNNNVIDNVDLAAVGSTLSGANYMGCQACNGGTSVANLISGKETYMNQAAPGRYYVHASASPTFDWFFNELTNGQDIEALIGFYNGNTRLGGHYITLNGINWTDTNNDGIIQSTEAGINYIDPNGGTNSGNPIYNFLNSTSLGTQAYVGALIGGQAITTTVVEYGIAESPVPEPGTITALAGLLFLAFKRVRKNR